MLLKKKIKKTKRFLILKWNYSEAVNKTLLVLIILIAIFLRFYKQAEFLDFFGDVGRDLLVAKHIVEDKQLTFASPTSNTSPYFNNSALYFNLIAIFWLLTPTVLGSISVHSFISIILPIMVYFINKKILNKWYGLFTAAIFSLSFYFVQAARVIWQPNLLPYIFTMGLYFFIQSFYSFKKKYIYISTLFFFLCLNVHYSFLVILPILSIWILERFWIIVKKDDNKRFYFDWIIFIIYLLTMFYFWKYLSGFSFNSLTQLFFNPKSQQHFEISKLLANFPTTLIKSSEIIFGYHKIFIVIYFTYLLVIAIKIKDHIIKKTFFHAKSVLYTLNFSVFFIPILNSPLQIHYFGMLIIVAYLSVPILINDSFKNNLYKVILLSFFLLVSLHSTSLDKKFIGIKLFFEKWERNEYTNAKIISQSIVADYSKLNPEHNQSLGVQVLKHNEPMFWNNGVYYLILEKMLNKRLANTTTTLFSHDLIANNNTQIISTKPDVLYIICDRFPNHSNLLDQCIHEFDKYYHIDANNKQYKIEKINRIDFYKYNNASTSLFRISK